MLRIRDLEGQQEQRDQIQQEAGDVADAMVEPGQFLRALDPLVVPPLRDKGGMISSAPIVFATIARKTFTRRGFSSPPNERPKSFSSEFRIPNQKM
jgi:hypothetical protein